MRKHPSHNRSHVVKKIKFALRVIIHEDAPIQWAASLYKNATTDPLARPRQIEVFARFEDKMERDQVFAITANWFRDDTTNRNVSVPLSDQFVKISDFEYVGNELNDGVHVQHIKDQFSNLGIGTDQIVVRSIGNYGAVDHTCFYRIRLFGNVVE